MEVQPACTFAYYNSSHEMGFQQSYYNDEEEFITSSITNAGNQSFGKECVFQSDVLFCGELKSESRNDSIGVCVCLCVCTCVCACACVVLKMQSSSPQLLFGAKISRMVPTTTNIENYREKGSERQET